MEMKKIGPGVAKICLCKSITGKYYSAKGIEGVWAILLLLEIHMKIKKILRSRPSTKNLARCKNNFTPLLVISHKQVGTANQVFDICQTIYYLHNIRNISNPNR